MDIERLFFYPVRIWDVWWRKGRILKMDIESSNSFYHLLFFFWEEKEESWKWILKVVGWYTLGSVWWTKKRKNPENGYWKEISFVFSLLFWVRRKGRILKMDIERQQSLYVQSTQKCRKKRKNPENGYWKASRLTYLPHIP